MKRNAHCRQISKKEHVLVTLSRSKNEKPKPWSPRSDVSKSNCVPAQTHVISTVSASCVSRVLPLLLFRRPGGPGRPAPSHICSPENRSDVRKSDRSWASPAVLIFVRSPRPVLGARKLYRNAADTTPHFTGQWTVYERFNGFAAAAAARVPISRRRFGFT